MDNIIRNPYTERAMITDPAMFFGRRAELETIFRRLAGSQCVAVVGERRIGKSSLLYRLTQPDVCQTHLPDPAHTVIAYLDLQGLGELTPTTLLTEALRVLGQVSGRRVVPERHATESGFRNWVQAACRAGWRLVLCLDEFEYLARCENLDEGFFAYLRNCLPSRRFGRNDQTRARPDDRLHRSPAPF